MGMPSFPIPHQSIGLALAGGLACCLGLANALPARAQNLSYPAPGVICDGSAKLCYDKKGLSVALTGIAYGQRAQQKAMTSLNNGTPSPEFKLSNGSVCSLALGACWEDGWSKRRLANNLSMQLFGVVPAVNPAYPNGIGTLDNGNGNSNSNWNSEAVRNSGICSLSRSGNRNFDGPCELKQVQGPGGTRYRVRLGNGTSFTFVNQGNGFRIEDAMGGSWPVQFVDQGPTGIFRWGNSTLVATQREWNGYQQGQQTPTGRALGNLLESLFR
jgi:hypothetical protein